MKIDETQQPLIIQETARNMQHRAETANGQVTQKITNASAPILDQPDKVSFSEEVKEKLATKQATDIKHKSIIHSIIDKISSIFKSNTYSKLSIEMNFKLNIIKEKSNDVINNKE